MPRYFPGYSEARESVLRQSLEADLDLIDSLFGRNELSYGDTPQEVKDEALRQLEREWTDQKWVDSPDGQYVAACVESARRRRIMAR